MHGAYFVSSLNEETLLDCAEPPPVFARQAAQRAHVVEHEIELGFASPHRKTGVGEQVDAGAFDLCENARALAGAIGNDGIAVADLSHSVRHDRLLVEVEGTGVGELWA